MQHGNYFAYVQKFNSRILSKYTLLLGQEEKCIIQSFSTSVGRKFISLMSLSKYFFNLSEFINKSILQDNIFLVKSLDFKVFYCSTCLSVLSNKCLCPHFLHFAMYSHSPLQVSSSLQVIFMS